MKKRLSLIALLAIGVFTATGQYPLEKVRKHAEKVQQWDTSGLKVLPSSNGEIELGNAVGDVLRFRADSIGSPVPYHCGIAYQLFEYEQGRLKRLSTFGMDGAVLGEAEFDGIAITELEIKKKTLLEKQFARLEAADGNIELNDEDQQIVLARMFDHKHQLLKEEFLSTRYYWGLQNRLYRP